MVGPAVVGPVVVGPAAVGIAQGIAGPLALGPWGIFGIGLT